MKKLLLSLVSFLFVAGSVFAQGAGSLPSGGAGGGGITPPAGDIGGTAVAPTVVGLQGIALPTLAGNTGCLLDTSGVLSLTSGACAPLLSPTFTGTPAGPTAAAGTNTTQLATTAFVNTIFAAPPSLGSTTPANVSASTLSASGVVSGAGFSTYLASPPAIGGTAAAAGSFTTLSASSTVSGTGFSTYLASPPAIGGTVAAAGSFTSLSSTGILSNSQAGALSAAAVSITGAPVTGGSGTTTFPLVYLNAGTGPTTFSTSGTEFGINAPSGFAGNFLDLHVNGAASVLTISSGGSINTAGSASFGKYTNNTGGHLIISGSAPTISAAGCGGSAASIANNNGTAAFTINVGTAPTSGGCAITLPAATTGWNCYVTDITTNSTSVFLQKQTVTSTTGATLVNFSDVAAATAPTANDIWAASCFAY